MELQYFGANCLRIATKKLNLVVDDNLSDLGLKSILKPDEVALFTGPHGSPATAKFMIDDPGEYEISDVSIQGIAARSQIDPPDKRTSVIYRLMAEDIRLLVLGHIYPELNDAQLEAIGTVDVLVLPVGGGGYTLDSVGALGIIKKIVPKIVVPTHYADKTVKYPVPQDDLETVLKTLAMEPSQTVPKLKVKASDLGEDTKLVVLERQ